MNVIPITVSGRIASLADPDAAVICGNTDDRVHFSLDGEWISYPVKTARFRYCQNGALLYQDVLFEGSECRIPVLHDITDVEIGLYAGDIRTTTAARVLCVPCITDGAPQHEDPAPDVYDQLLEYLAGLQGGGGIVAAAFIWTVQTTPFGGSLNFVPEE